MNQQAISEKTFTDIVGIRQGMIVGTFCLLPYARGSWGIHEYPLTRINLVTANINPAGPEPELTILI